MIHYRPLLGDDPGGYPEFGTRLGHRVGIQFILIQPSGLAKPAMKRTRLLLLVGIVLGITVALKKRRRGTESG
jgi:hypothetical protein